MKTQLVFTAYNRPYYLQDSIASWNAARGLTSWDTSFHIEPSNQMQAVVDIALQLNTSVTLYPNRERLGVLVNPWTALNTAFEQGADFVVLAEDDVVVSQDALEFFSWSAIEYATSYSTLCINAFSRIGGGKDNEIIADAAFSPLIWGVWRDRWENILRDTWDKDYSSGKADGSEAGWDWNINRILQANNQHVIKPVNSRSDHLGQYAGTHMTPDLYDTSRGVDYVQVRGKQRYREI